VIVRVDALEAEELIAAGVRTLDALPQSVYQQEHLPGAESLPLEQFQPSQVADWDRAEPVLVYCFDQHCDLSARTAHRLDDLGFETVYDLIGGRAGWTALGLPTEGEIGDQRRISRFVADPATVPLDATIAEVRRLGELRFPVAVVDGDGVLLGALQPPAAALPEETAVRDVMVPAPGTIRPELRIDEVAEQLHHDGLDHVFVTAVNGVLIGLVIADQLHV
jgi:rhodanese-related sulfurtransferase